MPTTIVSIKIVDLEVGKQVFEENGRVFSIQRSSSMPVFTPTRWSLITEVNDVNFNTDFKVSDIVQNSAKAICPYVSTVFVAIKHTVFYKEKIVETFSMWLIKKHNKYKAAGGKGHKKWFDSIKKELYIHFGRLGLGFGYIHRLKLASGACDQDIVISEFGVQLLTLVNAENDYEKLVSKDLSYFIDLFLRCIFFPLALNDKKIIRKYQNNPESVADELGLDKECLTFLGQIRYKDKLKGIPALYIFAHPIFYDIKKKMYFQENLCTEFLKDNLDDSINLINQAFADEGFDWRKDVKHDDVVGRMNFCIAYRMKEENRTDFATYKEEKQLNWLFFDFAMLYYNCKKHIKRFQKKDGKFCKRSTGADVYKLVDDELKGGSITEIYGRLLSYWRNDPTKMKQLMSLLHLH